MARVFTIDASEVFHNIERLEPRMLAGIKVIGNTTAGKMQDYAKSNHPWENRTHTAEARLRGKSELKGTELSISIAHGVDYGVWLETREDFQGRYQILEKARDSQIEEFKRMLLALKL